MRVFRSRRKPFAAILALFPALALAQVNPQAVFNKIRERVADSMRNANSYTCVETIARDWYMQKYHMRPICEVDRLTEPRNLILYKRDHLRLDVGIVHGQEVFSWYGESRFRTAKIDDLVTDGPITSGTFFSLLSSIFVAGHGRYFYRGTRGQGDNTEVIFTFQMSRAASRFALIAPSGPVIISYAGTFTADVRSCNLTTLQVTADDLPASIHVCKLQLNAGYSHQKSGAPFSAPSTVGLEVFTQNGDIVRTSTEYRNCHQFTGNSTIHFNGFDLSAVNPAPLPVRELPAGLPVRIRLTSPIELRAAWAGDAIEGELAANITDKKGTLFVEKGAKVTGRLLGCAQVLHPREIWDVDLQFNRIHTPEAEYRVLLQPKSRSFAPGWATGGSRRGVGSFELPGDKLRLDRRLETEWVTRQTKAQD